MDVPVPPRQRIVDYFEAMHIEVDQKAEDLFAENLFAENHMNNESINGKRHQFNNEIKQVAADNIRHYDSTNPSEYKYASRGDEAEDKLAEEKINAKLFQTFCFIIDKDDCDFPNISHLDASFGYLIIINKYLRRDQLDCYRELLKFSNKKLNDPNGLLSLKYKVSVTLCNKKTIYYLKYLY
jgi:hypothetical protein